MQYKTKFHITRLFQLTWWLFNVATMPSLVGSYKCSQGSDLAICYNCDNDWSQKWKKKIHTAKIMQHHKMNNISAMGRNNEMILSGIVQSTMAHVRPVSKLSCITCSSQGGNQRENRIFVMLLREMLDPCPKSTHARLKILIHIFWITILENPLFLPIHFPGTECDPC
jgi:hypothetical protein